MNKPIQIFNRHCFFSEVSVNKARPHWFSREACFDNLHERLDSSLADIHYFYDEAKGDISNHFLSSVKGDIKIVSEGTEAGAYKALLSHILSFNFQDDTIIYIVEDDYLHRGNWCRILMDGFISTPASYVTLYDHSDKYNLAVYPEIKTRLWAGNITHWRSTPSTTNTFAATFKTLKEDLEVHNEFSSGHPISRDHARFCALKYKGRLLVSSMPGFSTHCETAYLSPCIDWENYV